MGEESALSVMEMQFCFCIGLLFEAPAETVVRNEIQEKVLLLSANPQSGWQN